MSGCTGACCAVFTLPYSWEELQARDRGLNGSLAEAALIADMAIPLTRDQALERAADFDVSRVPTNGRLFTCRHWDEATRLCTIYDRRPVMCRDYPYDGSCEHCAWTHDDVDVFLRWWFIRHDGLPLVSRYSAGMREVDRDRRSSRNVRALR